MGSEMCIRDRLVDAVVARMGEQRARQGYKFRKLLLPIQKAVERHFALRRAETVVVTNAEGRVLLSNVELRSLVRQLLRREDLREGYTVKQCREAVMARLQAGEGVTRAEEPGVSLNGPGFGGLVLQEWSCLWESAWRDYVYHVEELQEGCCRARVRTLRSSRGPVLRQCGNAVSSAGATYCALHQGRRLYGDWDFRDGFSGIGLPSKVQEVIAEAKRRALDTARIGLVRGFNVPGPAARGGPGGRGRVAMQPHPVPVYVDRPDQERHARCFSPDPVALPPFPCLVCPDADFGSEEALRVHIEEAHGSMEEYRKALLFEASKGRKPVTPQVWRLVVGHVVEEVTSGTRRWPECAGADLEDALEERLCSAT